MKTKTLILFFLICQFRSTAQDIVKDQGITSTIHQANIGRIIFTSTDITPKSLTPGNTLKTYTLTNKADLFITAFLAHSLTSYMHQLAPDMPLDSLRKAGGYQFTLYVDDHEIYRSNILGAPLPPIRDTQTIISKPLIDNSDEGAWWSQSYWTRFIYHGGDSALTEGPHRLKLEIRPHVGGKNGPIIASGELNMLVNRKPVIDLATVKLNPIQPYKDLAVSTENFDKNKIKELKGKIEAAEFKKITGIVVIKNGKILIEEYFNGESRDSLHDTRSVGKSFASTMLGIAEHDGYITNEEQTLKQFYQINNYANYNPEKENIPLKDLLTMSSAFDGDDNDDSSPGNEENMYPTENWVKWTLDLPLSPSRPRDRWHYFTAGAMLMGDILNKTVPGGLEKYADEKLFQPLDIQYQWVYTPQHVPSTAGGIKMKALDFAKYGQLYKNNGTWNGRQIIPKAWITKTFTKYRPLPDQPNEYYGYFFWNKTYKVGGHSYETWYCTGNGGNKIFIFKDQPLVIVITATAYGQPYAHPQVDRMMIDYILPAIISAP